MPLPELLGIEVRSAVSSGHCHPRKDHQRVVIAVTHMCPSGTSQGNLAQETQGGYRTKPHTFSGSLIVFPLYNYVSKTVDAFPSSLLL